MNSQSILMYQLTLMKIISVSFSILWSNQMDPPTWVGINIFILFFASLKHIWSAQMLPFCGRQDLVVVHFFRPSFFCSLIDGDRKHSFMNRKWNLSQGMSAIENQSGLQSSIAVHFLRFNFMSSSSFSLIFLRLLRVFAILALLFFSLYRGRSH